MAGRPVNLAGQRLARKRSISSIESMELMAVRVFPHELKI